MATANDSGTPLGGEAFLTTRWSLVLAAGATPDGADAGARASEALADLCAAYWYPLYAYVRRRGHSAADAADLVQGFFARVLEKGVLRAVAPERGRFRAFLLASLKNYLSNERDRAAALKRGGGRVSLSIDFDAADARYRGDVAGEASPDKLFERSWALELLERTLAALGEEYAATGRGRVFEALRPELQGASRSGTSRELAAELGMTEGAVKVSLHRLRARYRARLRAEIAGTVATEEEIEDEIRALFDALAG